MAIGWAAVENHAELVAEGDLSTGMIYAPMRIEADALLSLLEVAPESEHEKIHALLHQYETLMAALVN